MKKVIFLSLIVCSFSLMSQTVKSKILKLKYTTPESWTASEFGGLLNWDEKGNEMCRCSGVAFSKPNKNGKFNVVIYAVAKADWIQRNVSLLVRYISKMLTELKKQPIKISVSKNAALIFMI